MYAISINIIINEGVLNIICFIVFEMCLTNVTSFHNSHENELLFKFILLM